mgnify:CR=1 FL=1
MRQTIFILAFLCFSGALSAQSSHQLLRRGNKDYDKQQFTEAEEKYRKSLEQDGSVKSKYNLGNAVYQQEKYKEAIKHYEETAASATDKNTKAKAYHNLGNAYVNQAQQQPADPKENPNEYLKKAVNAYKESLRNNPKDLDTKHNLSMAIRQLRKMQQQQQQQQQKGDSDKQQKDSKEDKNQDSKDSKQQKEQDKKQQQQSQQQQEQEEKKKKEQQKGKQMKREEAKKLLQIMNDEEKKVQEKVRRTKGSKRNSSKYW